MSFLRAIILAAVLIAFAGCRSVESPDWYSEAWRGFPYQEAKEILNDYRTVLLVRVTADRMEKVEVEVAGGKESGGYLQHYTGTVVKSYKGSCKVAERVAFVAGYCPCGGERPVTTNAFVGDLMFLLAEDRVRAGAEFGIEPFDIEPYEPQTDRLFTHLFRPFETQP